MYLFSFFIFMVCSSRLVCAVSWNFEIYSLGRRSIQFNLRAHLLQTSGKNLNLLFLLRDRRFQFLHSLMLFEEFVQQHRVHRVVAHGVNFTVLVTHYEVGVHSGHFFGDQTKLRYPNLVALVVESHRLESQDGFAGCVHRLNLFLEPARGRGRAELPVDVYQNWQGVGVSGCHPTHSGDKGSRLSTLVADADGIALASHTKGADIDIRVACSEIAAGLRAQGDVAGAGGVVNERILTNGRVEAADCVAKESELAGSCVCLAVGIAKERLKTAGGVVVARVAKEGFMTVGCVGAAVGVAKKGERSIGRVLGADGVAKKRSEER